MHIVEYKNPYTDKLETKKFKGKYAPENSFSYAKKNYENYYMNIEICVYELGKDKKKQRKYCFNKIKE